MTKIALVFLSFLPFISGLDNGLARTPPMGWLTWERFRCVTDCVNYPDTCISEKLIKNMADEMVKGGFLKAGYEYIIIDDCWLDKTRDPQGRLRPDPLRFPSGIKALADYVHAKGLKFGIYEDFGTKTCAGFPGSEFFMQMDANTFAEWGVDYVKFDGCNSEVSQMDEGVAIMSSFLNKTGRPMVFSCENPLYERAQPNYASISEHCNLWRNFNDISDSWTSVWSVIEFYGQNKYNFSNYARPGAWNDPDMLVIGNYGLSYDEERVQMALWSMMASPLIMSTDLRSIRSEARALLQNAGAIAINQDPLGIQGTRMLTKNSIQLWTRPISPKGSFAVAIMNTGAANPQRVSMKISDITKSTLAYTINEVFDGKTLGTFKASDSFTCDVNPSGVQFIKLHPLKRDTNLYFRRN